MAMLGAPFRLSLASLPRDALAVRELRGTEKLSGPYRFDVTCTARESLPALAELLQSSAVLTLWTAGAPRVFSGAVAAVAHEGTRRDADGSEQVRVRIVPRFALRKHRKNSRIFQGLPVPEIVKAILGEAGVTVEMRLRHQYPDRVYCTQYQETDTAFVSRILAEAGIFSFWQPPSASPEAVEALEDDVWGGDTLVLGDTAAAYQEAVTPFLPFLHAGGTLGQAAAEVTRLVPRAAVRPERATFREYDSARPLAVREASAQIPERSDSPLEIYDHEAPFLYSGWKVTQEEPGRRLQTARAEARLAHGESTAPHLATGHRFTLESHPWEPANGAHVVLEVRHEGWATPQGTSPERYRNRFVTAPATEVVSPEGPRKRTLGFTLTATVTGPQGEEIHVDEQGRIKAQFHWDREGKRDDRSSCWLRVMQSWSGSGWGSQFVPRVGMEVVVSFEGGDPDKPMVLGCLPNGTHPPPFALPGSKTKSGLRTQSRWLVSNGRSRRIARSGSAWGRCGRPPTRSAEGRSTMPGGSTLHRVGPLSLGNPGTRAARPSYGIARAVGITRMGAASVDIRCKLTAAQSIAKSCRTRSLPRIRARRPPWRRRIKCPSFRSTLGRVAL